MIKEAKDTEAQRLGDDQLVIMMAVKSSDETRAEAQGSISMQSGEHSVCGGDTERHNAIPAWVLKQSEYVREGRDGFVFLRLSRRRGHDDKSLRIL